MSGVLCIDFGTSSIRAVRRMPNGNLKPLDIGRIARSQLDDASIRSEIHIDALGRYVRFGERAIKARADSPNALLYESSPKLWLRDPDRLKQPAAPGLNLTRENLLAGLLANALHGCVTAMSIGDATLRQIEVRIAHPVWPDEVSAKANAALERLSAQAQKMVFDREWATVTVSQLEAHTQTAGAAVRVPVDLLEPVAAAVELLPSAENARRVCAVVDVGAGTTDIGLFQAVAPDSASSVRGKLYPLGEPVSVFKAGNVVDEIVLNLMISKARRPSQVEVQDLQSRVRQVKETLFEQGFVQELGVTVSLDELRSHADAKLMAREIRSALETVVQRNRGPIIGFMDARTHYVTTLELVMAGGGANIDFIRKALEKPLVLDGKQLQVEITESQPERGLNFFGAGRGRMAVALGGAREEYDQLIHQMAPVRRFVTGRL